MSPSPEATNDAADPGLEDPPAVTVTSEPLLEPPPEPPPLPRRIGRYRVDAVIGRGSMGMVLRAHDPRLDRVVALKLLHGRAWLHGPDATAQRLQREAQALARLSHPNVVDVFDVGTADGRIFVAMEYVAGQTLDAWIRERAPTRAAVIDAFVQAGRGLAAAHHAGLVHRDFKPANVLRGDDGRVRVVDFGLAAAPRDTEGSATPGSQEGPVLDVRVTATGFVVGTPAYMAPEAHGGGPVDARSDQFSFCVALFEVLYGERPFPGTSPREVFDRAQRGAIRVPAGADVPAALREVVLRGLRPSPAERWPGMDALLERLEPRRRGRRWWQAGAVAVASTVGVALWWLPADPSPAATCEEAEVAVAEVWNDDVRARVHDAFMGSALPYAEASWLRVSRVLDTRTQALGQARREACEGRLVAAAPAALDRRMTCLGQRLSELRGVVAVLERADATAVRHAVGVLGDLLPLATCDDEALATAIPPPPPAVSAQVEQAHDELARVGAMRRAGDYDRARALALAVIDRVEPLGYAPLLAEARYLYGNVLEDAGDYAGAEAAMSDAVMLAQAAGHDALLAQACTQLVFVVGNRLRRPADAERWIRHARAAIARLADPQAANTFLESTLGNYHWGRGELDLARQRFEAALQARERDDGPRHPTTLLVRSNLAMVHHDLGDHTRARALLERVLADRILVYGPEHPEVATTYGNLAVLEQVMGELDASVEHGRRALAMLEASVGRTHPHYGQLLMNLSNTEYLRGNLPEALRLHEDANALLVQSLGPRDLIVGRALSNLGALYLTAERHAEARDSLRRAREILEENLPLASADLCAAIGNLALVDLRSGRLAEALAGSDEAIARFEASLGPDHPKLVGVLLQRGEVYVRLERFAAAITDLRRAVAMLAHPPSGSTVEPGQLADARFDLAQALWGAGERAEAVREMERARASIAGAAAGDERRARIDTWLTEHPGGGRSSR